jgi:vitamin B12 transporter
LQARVANVFDHAYETAAYYPQAGREWSLTLRYAAK